MTADTWLVGVFVKRYFKTKMDLTSSITNITFCTYNCRFVKSSVVEIQDMCAKSDLVCLQEHWLLPNEVDFFITES